jgi:hypothetical protein
MARADVDTQAAVGAIPSNILVRPNEKIKKWMKYHRIIAAESGSY